MTIRQTILRDLAISCTVVLLLALLFTAPDWQYDKITSPDGRYSAEAKYAPFLALLPYAWGHMGSVPGRITFNENKTGICVYTAYVDMVSSLYEIAWSNTTATIPYEGDIVLGP